MSYSIARTSREHSLSTSNTVVYLPLPAEYVRRPFYAHSLHMYFTNAYAIANSVVVTLTADKAGDIALTPATVIDFTYGETTASKASAIAVLEIACPINTGGVYLHINTSNATAILSAAYLSVS